MRDGRKLAIDTAASAVSSLRTAHLGSTYRIRDDAIEFAYAHWEDFCKFAVNLPAITLEGAVTTRQELATAGPLSDVLDTKSGTVVSLHHGKYILSTEADVQIMAHDELPPHVKRAVGMLKLANDKQYVPGFGVRATENTFYVLPEQP